MRTLLSANLRERLETVGIIGLTCDGGTYHAIFDTGEYTTMSWLDRTWTLLEEIGELRA